MESNSLIESFKSANQSLRKRAITIGILMLITVALRYSERLRADNVSNLLQYEVCLSMLNELPDDSFKEVVDGKEHEYFSIPGDEWLEYSRLLEKIRNDDYKRSMLFQAIDSIELRIDEYNKEESIGILGVTIPLEPVAYLSLIFVLVLFHDFTQVIIFRNQIYRRIRKYNVSPLELGFEFFGFYNTTRNSGLKFLRFTSTLITTALIICPSVTSYLMLDLNRSNNSFLSVLNVVCFTLIVIDTLIILHVENTMNFRYLCNLYLGKHNLSKTQMRIIWVMPILLVTSINIELAILLLKGFLGIHYLVMCLIPPVLLYTFLNRTYNNPTKRNRAMRAGLLVTNIFWIYASFHQINVVDEWSMYKITMLWFILFCTILFSAFFAFVYMKFFMDSKRINSIK